jgi:hypothetical protein
MAPKLLDFSLLRSCIAANLVVFQGYNGKDLPPLQQDKVCWQNHLLGGWTVQQTRSNIEDCSPTAVEFKLCPGDLEGCTQNFKQIHLFLTIFR